MIKVSEDTHRRLSKQGSKGETYDDIIKKLLDEHEAKSKGKWQTT